MRQQAFLGSLALSGVAMAFSDATPWVMYSTAPFDTPVAKQLQTGFGLMQNVKNILATCPTDHYVVATQPGMRASDLRPYGAVGMPALQRSITQNPRIKGKYIVSEVVGDVADKDFVGFIHTACNKRGKIAVVEELSLAQLLNDGRAATLLANDKILETSISEENTEGAFTVILYGPEPEPAYEAGFEETFHMDLKRATQEDSLDRIAENRPLFEKYQFFTPGIFMGLVTAIVLFSILGIGIRALLSLEVSYGAFEKEMGPAAQKKQP